jgi:hypothetical protein
MGRIRGRGIPSGWQLGDGLTARKVWANVAWHNRGHNSYLYQMKTYNFLLRFVLSIDSGTSSRFTFSGIDYVYRNESDFTDGSTNWPSNSCDSRAWLRLPQRSSNERSYVLCRRQRQMNVRAQHSRNEGGRAINRISRRTRTTKSRATVAATKMSFV